jgi:hypothetical protein
VLAADATDFSDACSGARNAVSFFADLGLPPTEPLVLEIVSEMPEDAGPTAVGCYLKRRGRVLMLPYREFRQRTTWFNLPISRDVYRSVAAHETAHALAACNFSVPTPTLQAHEYVAYVVMFATMTPALRERILKALPGDGFETEAQINAIVYMFDPMQFGVEAYRHYLRPENGRTFLFAVLAGKALTD